MTPEGLTLGNEVEALSNPFPGLRPFEFDESHLYFGRDGQSDQLIRKLNATRFVAVVGTSGSGKSSLVRAGLLPDLYSGYMSSVGSHWRVCLMRPGNDPLGNLARSLNVHGVFGSDVEENAEIQTTITEATLRRGGLGLVEAVRQNRMPSNESLLVVVDQFEELFRFARVSGSEEYRYEAAAFVKLLLEAARQREQAIYVVLTMRSDFLGDCSIFWDLPEAINEGQYLIPRMTRDQRAEAINGPVAVCGGEATPRLVNRLLNDTGDNPDQLPILQHALMRTWERWREDHAEGEPLDLRHYEAVGTMAGALSRHADEAYAELPDERSRTFAEKIFKSLTERGEDNREIRRPTELKKLCALSGATLAEAAHVVEVFRREGRSFLMPPESVTLDEDSLIDISHESLIRNWERLKNWVAEESGCAEIYTRLAETAVLYEKQEAGLWRDPDLQLGLDWRKASGPSAAWATRYHPAFDSAMSFLDASVAARDKALREEESRRRREVKRARVTAAVFFLLFMLSLAASGYAYNQSLRAEEKSKLAEEKSRLAEEAKKEAEQSSIRAAEKAELARWNAIRAADSEATAVEEKKKADASKLDAIRQAQIAKRNEEIASAATKDALAKRQEAEASKIEADRQAGIAKQNEEKARQNEERANVARAKAVEAAVHSGKLFYAADINLAQQAYESNNITRARDLLEEFTPFQSELSASEFDVPKEKPGFEWFYLKRQVNRRANVLLASGPVQSLALTKDGRTLVAVEGDSVVIRSGSPLDNETKIDPKVGAVNSLALSPDDKYLAVCGSKPVVRLFDFATRKEIGAFEGHTGAVTSVVFSPDGVTLATGGEDQIARVWDVPTRQVKAQFNSQSFISALKFHPRGKMLAIIDRRGSILLWDMAAEKWMMLDPNVEKRVVAIDISSAGISLLSGREDGKIEIFNLVTGNAEIALTSPEGTSPVSHVSFSPDEKLMAIGYEDGTVIICDRWSQEQLATLKGHDAAVTSATFLPGGKYLVTGGLDSRLNLWDVSKRAHEQAKRRGHQNAIKAVAFSPDGATVATGSVDKTVILWDAETRERRGEPLKGHGSAVTAVAFSPKDGGVLASASEDKTVRLWAVASGKELAKLDGHTDVVTSVAFTPDGKLLATGSRDLTIRLWDVQAHKLLRTIPQPERPPIRQVAFSPDGKRSAAMYGDGSVGIWDGVFETEQQGHARVGGGTPSDVLLFSPDGKSTARSFIGGVIRVSTGNVGFSLSGKPALSAAFSPDGRIIAVGTADNTVELWDLYSKQELLTLRGHTGQVTGIAFAPDGRTLATVGTDGALRLWRAYKDNELLYEESGEGNRRWGLPPP